MVKLKLPSSLLPQVQVDCWLFVFICCWFSIAKDVFGWALGCFTLAVLLFWCQSVCNSVLVSSLASALCRGLLNLHLPNSASTGPFLLFLSAKLVVWPLPQQEVPWLILGPTCPCAPVWLCVREFFSVSIFVKTRSAEREREQDNTRGSWKEILVVILVAVTPCTKSFVTRNTIILRGSTRHRLRR